ncbi:hypothetical protein GCM10008014_54890 [Paenibacillus silvae]|uniref:Uncharacterized protein n=1 Tax=Paenibacillus silvae TaxID=1325358 RepID=A0ABQ1ZP92_9BACL|nr:hypothetical protein GCM10008014_54890 [Paenibacillus silvae]
MTRFYSELFHDFIPPKFKVYMYVAVVIYVKDEPHGQVKSIMAAWSAACGVKVTDGA